MGSYWARVYQLDAPQSRVRPVVFGIVGVGLLLVLLLIGLTIPGAEDLATTVSGIAVVILAPTLLGVSLMLLLLCVAIFVSPWGAIHIGGVGAERIYPPFQWFSVSLTTVIAMGVLFWAVAEPVVHAHEPPPFWGQVFDTGESAPMALATALAHWTLAPHAIYTVTGLAFAVGFYNRGYRFSVGALLKPTLRMGDKGLLAVDGLVLFAIVAGMSAVLSVGLLLVGEGLGLLFGVPQSSLLYGAVALVIMSAALYSTHRGLKRGIGVWARVNVVLFFGLVLYVLAMGPTYWIFQLGVDASSRYLTDILPNHLALREQGDSYWSARWTAILLASWFAWAPLVCLFLARIARGYTLRQFILVNLLLPSVFGAVWFSIFGAAALYFDGQSGGGLYGVYQSGGLGAMTYHLFSFLPGGFTLSVLFVLVCLVSFITAADSNLSAIGGLCTRSDNTTSERSPFVFKLLWAVVIGLIGWGSLTFLGAQGIRLLALVAGFPGLIIVMGSAIALLLMLVRPPPAQRSL